MARKLSEMLAEPKNWLKMAAGNGIDTFCLGSALNLLLHGSHQAYTVPDSWLNPRMIAIVKRLFPERCQTTFPFSAIVTFNNHPATTFEDIQKVVHEWEREEEAGAPIL